MVQYMKHYVISILQNINIGVNVDRRIYVPVVLGVAMEEVSRIEVHEFN